MDKFFDQFIMDENFIKTVEEVESLNKELKYDQVPDGKYRVEILHMDVMTSKKGNLMLRVGFKVLSGQYENTLVWSYFMLNNRNIENANSFLRALKTDAIVKFTGVIEYKKLIEEILINVKGWKEFDLQIKTGYTGFKNYTILNAYEKEMEELPFS